MRLLIDAHLPRKLAIQLKELFLKNVDKLEQTFTDARFIELTRESLIVHI
ncbi:MAG: hypothetical protein RLZZ215_44 [Pseudomonadota bacterium]|jgi:predicted nuclease of predicted toxin-antitoxin system